MNENNAAEAAPAEDQAAISGMPTIIGMPPQLIITGMPPPIIAIIRRQASVNISMLMPSIGIISQVMPVGVVLQVILHIMTGIMPPIIAIWGIIWGIMPGIIPDIMLGIMPIIGIMPCIIWGIMFGIMPIIGFIGMAWLVEDVMDRAPRRGGRRGATISQPRTRRKARPAAHRTFLRAIGGAAAILEAPTDLTTGRPIYWRPVRAGASPGPRPWARPGPAPRHSR
ncbi:hypothetical protein ACTOWL_22690 [Inquilinus sp. CA228]